MMKTKMETEGRKAEEEKDPRASSAVASQQQQQQQPKAPPRPPPPPLPRSALAETLAEASGVPSVVRYALWSLENAERDDNDGDEEKNSSPSPSSPSSSSSSSSPPRRRLLLPLLPAGKQSLLRLLAVAHAALLEAGRCWPEEGEEEEEEDGEGEEEDGEGEGEEGGEMREGEEGRGAKKKKTAALARALSLPRRFLASLPSSSSSTSSSSSSLPPLAYSTLRGAAGSLRVTSLGGAFALVSAGISAAAAPPSSPPSAPPPPSFPTAFSVTVKLSDHFDATDGSFLQDNTSRLWRLLCDAVASPLASSAAAAAGLPPLEASLLGTLPEDLLLEVLLAVARGYRESPPEGGGGVGARRKKEEEEEDRRERGCEGGRPRERGYYAERLRGGVASGMRRCGVPCGPSSLGLSFLDFDFVPPLPRGFRQEWDLISVAQTCKALKDVVFGGQGGGGSGGGGGGATPAAASASSSLIWDAAAAALDRAQAPRRGGGLAFLRTEGLRARSDASIAVSRAAARVELAQMWGAAALPPNPLREEALQRDLRRAGRAAEDPFSPSWASLHGGG